MSKNKYIMKRNLLFIVFLCCTCLGIYAAPFRFLETIVTQADGSQLALYASGDEFYHWIHDKDGYTIVQAEDGYCYYAIKTIKENWYLQYIGWMMNYHQKQKSFLG